MTPDTSNHNRNYRPASEPIEESQEEYAERKHRTYSDQREMLPNIMPEHIERIVITPVLVQTTGPEGEMLKPVTVLYREIVLTEAGHEFLTQGYADLKAGKESEYTIVRR